MSEILFSPVKLGKLSLKNRFMRSPCDLNDTTSNGILHEKAFNYYMEMAKGGWGLVIPGCSYPHHNGRSFITQPGMETKEQSESWRPIIDEMHKNDTKIIFQLGDGGLGMPKTPGRVLRGPSAMGDGTRGMSHSEIKELIEHFVLASVNAESAGADGIQIHAAHGYMLNEFLSPYSNHREDEYGGTAENRRRIIQEIIDGVRENIHNKDFVIGIKINWNDFKGSEGIQANDFAETIKALKGLDLIEVSCSFLDGRKSIRSKIKSKQLEGYPFVEGYNIDGMRAIRNITNTPIGVVGGWRTIPAMEKAIKEGVDLISLGRPSIADPKAVLHLQQGQKIKCVSCNHCIEALNNDSNWVECILNIKH